MGITFLQYTYQSDKGLRAEKNKDKKVGKKPEGEDNRDTLRKWLKEQLAVAGRDDVITVGYTGEIRKKAKESTPRNKNLIDNVIRKIGSVLGYKFDPLLVTGENEVAWEK